MKSPAPHYPWEEQGALEAIKALKAGDEKTLAAYLADLAVALSRLQTALKPTDGAKASLVFAKNRRGPKPKSRLLHKDADWDSTLVELEEALHLASSEVVASYLHDAASVLRRLSKALAPPSGGKSKKLIFKYASRGKPHDPVKQMRNARATKRAVFMAKDKNPKMDAAVAQVGAKLGMSRGTVFKHLKAQKSRS